MCYNLYNSPLFTILNHFGALFFVVVGVIFFHLGSTTAIDAQQKYYSSDLLFIALFSNGESQISNDINFINEQVQVSIPLLGYNISRINVVDHAGNPIEFVQEENKQPKEVSIKSPNKQGIRIAYQASDLAQNINKKWVFSINSSVPFTLKLPINSTIIDWNITPISFELLGEQHLMSFNSGNVTMSYIIENKRMESIK
jgi:hypothetical protein